MYPFFLENFILPLGSLFFGGNFHRKIKEWERYDTLSELELAQLQEERLKEMKSYALKKVPYYQSLGIKEDTPLEEWPILSKDLLRKHHKDLVSTDYDVDKLVKNFSSGSSGHQSFTYMTHEERFLVRAIQTHWWKWGGYRPGEPMLQFGISPQRSFAKRLKDLFFRVHYQEAFRLGDAKLDRIIRDFSQNRSQHVAGYPSAINELAKRTLLTQKKLPFTSLHSLGDKLFDAFRENFNQAFNEPTIVNTYGCGEGFMMACQLDLDAYYIMSPHVYIEIVDDHGNRVLDGVRGHIIVTNLTNTAMPLFRYKLGDLGTILPKEAYPAERKFAYPLLKEVVGRETDVIKTPNGVALVVHSFTGIFEYIQEIKQYKVIQESPDRLEIQYIPDGDADISTEILHTLNKKLSTLVDHSMKISFKRVEGIETAPSGKPQILESRVKNRS